METINYASRAPRKSCRPVYYCLAVSAICLVVVASYYLAAAYHSPGFPGPPEWLRRLSQVAEFFGWVGAGASILSLLLLIPRFKSVMHLIGVTFIAFIILGGLPIVLFLAYEELRSSYHRPWYLQLMANGRGIAQSANIYASDNAGRYPEHVAVLVITGQVAPQQLSSRYLTPYVPPVPMPAESDWLPMAAAVDASSLFNYTGADLTGDPPAMGATIILLYSKSCSWTPGYRVVVFADAHQELLRETDLPPCFAASNAARAMMGLPPFYVDGLVPALPTASTTRP